MRLEGPRGTEFEYRMPQVSVSDGGEEAVAPGMDDNDDDGGGGIPDVL